MARWQEQLGSLEMAKDRRYEDTCAHDPPIGEDYTWVIQSVHETVASTASLLAMILFCWRGKCSCHGVYSGHGSSRYRSWI